MTPRAFLFSRDKFDTLASMDAAPTQTYSTRERWFLVSLALFALALRVAYLVEIYGTPLVTHLRLDEQFHRSWAESIAAGNILGDKIFFRAPFYPYWLGTIFALFGHGTLLPRVIQHLLGIGSVVLLYVFARSMFGKPTATIAAILMASYAFLIYLEDRLLFESILIFQILLLAVVLLRAIEKPSLLRWLGAGILLGLICITRPVFLPFLPGILLAQAWSYRDRVGWNRTLRWMSILTVGFLAAVAPVTVRNYVVGHDFVIIASQGGLNFYIGNNASADGYSSRFPGDPGLQWEQRDIANAERQGLGHQPTPSEASRFWYEEGLQFIISHPADFALLELKKLYYFWNAYEIPNNDSFYSFVRLSSVLTYLPTGFWLVGPLGLYGMWLMMRHRGARLIQLSLVGYMCIILLFFVCDRYRAPILPFLCLFAGSALTSLWTRREADLRFLWRSVPLALLLFFVNSNFAGFSKDTENLDLFNRGNMALDDGNPAGAIESYAAMRGSAPIPQNANLNWGVASWELGKPREALRKFHEELARSPRSYDALSNIAHLYYLIGSADSAIRYAQRAINIKPYGSAAYVDLAFAYGDLNRVDLAESTLNASLSWRPSDSLYVRSLLAGLHLLRGDAARAEQEYTHILAASSQSHQPDYAPEFDFSDQFKFGGGLEHFRARVLYSLGHASLLLDHGDSALAYFEHAVEDWPGFSDAWFDLGISLRKASRAEEADSAFRRGLAIDSTNATAWYNYGVLMDEMGRTIDAARAFENSRRLEPGIDSAGGQSRGFRKE